MAKTTIEKRMSVEEQIRQLENQRKQLLQKEKSEERKARTKRLIERGAIAESLIENSANLTNEQFKLLVTNALMPQKLVTSKPDLAESELEQSTPLA